MSLDGEERNRIFGVRQLMRVLGMLTAGTLGAYVVGQGAESTRVMAFALALFIVVFVLAGVSRLPRERADFQGRAAESPLKAIRDVAANPHARLLLLVMFIDAIGVGGIGMLIPFVIEYVVGMKHLVPT